MCAHVRALVIVVLTSPEEDYEQDASKGAEAPGCVASRVWFSGLS
jgi:hypothetical protein